MGSDETLLRFKGILDEAFGHVAIGKRVCLVTKVEHINLSPKGYINAIAAAKLAKGNPKWRLAYQKALSEFNGFVQFLSTKDMVMFDIPDFRGGNKLASYRPAFFVTDHGQAKVIDISSPSFMIYNNDEPSPGYLRMHTAYRRLMNLYRDELIETKTKEDLKSFTAKPTDSYSSDRKKIAEAAADREIEHAINYAKEMLPFRPGIVHPNQLGYAYLLNLITATGIETFLSNWKKKTSLLEKELTESKSRMSQEYPHGDVWISEFGRFVNIVNRVVRQLA